MYANLDLSVPRVMSLKDEMERILDVYWSRIADCVVDL